MPCVTRTGTTMAAEPVKNENRRKMGHDARTRPAALFLSIPQLTNDGACSGIQPINCGFGVSALLHTPSNQEYEAP
jgi:hypothetical protein